MFLIYAKLASFLNLTSKGTNIALKYQQMNSTKLNLEFLVKKWIVSRSFNFQKHRLASFVRRTTCHGLISKRVHSFFQQAQIQSTSKIKWKCRYGTCLRSTVPVWPCFGSGYFVKI